MRFDAKRTVPMAMALVLTFMLGVAIPGAGLDRTATAASNPDLRLRPNDGPPGTTSAARGRNFSPNATGVIIWDADGSILADFTADGEGEFEVQFVVPDAPSGLYTVSAQAGDESASDEFEIERDDEPAATAPPVSAATPPPLASAERTPCPEDATRDIAVTNAVELTEALAAAQPGDRITLADGVYLGTFVAEASGSADRRITLCGSRNAIVDGGDSGNGYALHITGDYWTIHGITVSNALKGVMLDDADFTMLDQIEVHTIGHEAVHFRSQSSDNVIQNSDIHDTGLKRDKFGEGVYIGSAVSNWSKYAAGDDGDQSDRNQVLNNRIWNTTSESIDIKEGTTGGLIDGNSFDGSALSGADSWVDVKGNDYLIRNNTGVNSPTDGFQTHVINDMPWGQHNTFENNIADVNGDGFGFYIHNAESSSNTVSCSNQVTDAEKGFANVECV